MPYATQQDLIDQEGEDAVFAAFDRDRDGVLDTTAIADALDNASATIDSYVSVRYPLTLPSAPLWAKRICIDLALYFGSRSADALTNELRKRYEDNLDFLKQVAAGKAGLGIITDPATQQPVEERGEIKTDDVLVLDEPDGNSLSGRQFTRNRMGRL